MHRSPTSPDGKKLVCLSNTDDSIQHALGFDVSTGTLLFKIPISPNGKSIDWFGNDYFMVSRYLISCSEKRVPLQGHDQYPCKIVHTTGQVIFIDRHLGRNVLYTKNTLPDFATEIASARTQPNVPDFSAGDSIAVNFQIPANSAIAGFDSNFKSKVQESLKGSGLKIDDKAKFKLSFVIKDLPTGEVIDVRERLRNGQGKNLLPDGDLSAVPEF